ncbi:MAG TPA: proton-conducting transporter membrane subunit [Myxococcota bacterium]|nr:proton-conducting transporter membrane subunit [Myxococcota bacterium]
MTQYPAPVALELTAALCIALSGAPAYLLGTSARGSKRLDALRQTSATALNGIGSALGLAALVLYVRSGDASTLVIAPLPIGRLAFALDGLSALFLVPILIVSALGSVYGSSYWREEEHRESGCRLRLGWGIMTASMIAVVLARDAVAFLIAWEVMALAAFFLMGADEQSAEVRRASWIYLVATHAGTLCLLGFFALLGALQGSSALWLTLGAAEGGSLSTALFALGTLGFGLKAGLMPLHVWLPGAHANAPSHVSALLSGVLLKMGIYGVVRVCGLLPHPPVWWGATLIGVGALSGVLGIVLALAQHDLKRLLAYSSIENIGIIAVGVGLATLGRALGRADLVALALGGALFHVLNHALFKPLLFFVAGSVLHATGSRRVSSLGGLARSMPSTFAVFAVGAVAICGLPPLNGFASEWLLFIALSRAVGVDAGHGAVWAGLAAPALALIGALAVAGFVKIAGIAFSGEARSEAAARAHDPAAAMLAPMIALASACVLLGVVPGAAMSLLERAISTWDPSLENVASALATLAPLGWISISAALLIAFIAASAAIASGWRAQTRLASTWDCGYAHPTPRMQYVGASFSETLVSLFDWAVRARRALLERPRLFPRATRFEYDVPDVVLDRAVLPLARIAERKMWHVRALQRGPVQMYLLYMLLAVVILLMVAP